MIKFKFSKLELYQSILFLYSIIIFIEINNNDRTITQIQIYITSPCSLYLVLSKFILKCGLRYQYCLIKLLYNRQNIIQMF